MSNCLCSTEHLTSQFVRSVAHHAAPCLREYLTLAVIVRACLAESVLLSGLHCTNTHRAQFHGPVIKVTK